MPRASSERNARAPHVASSGRPALRLFFAVQPDDSARQLLSNLAGEVARLTVGRAARAENLHVTLAFLGEVAQETIPVVAAIGAASAAVSEPFVITLDHVGFFRDAGIAWIAPTANPDALMHI